jgi:asparagine synthase (glutamine-hydrolysing)
MSAVLGVFASSGKRPEEQSARRMLLQMAPRGSDSAAVVTDASALLGAAREGWELTRGFSGAVLVVQDADLLIAADASLYYCEDLRRNLIARGVHPSGDTPSHLILAAYRAWGERCVDYLEGDWAFALWDGTEHRVFCSRDIVGSRPLYYAQIGDSLVVASTISGILGYPGCPHDLNLVAVADAASGLFASGYDTCYQAIQQLPAGCNLQWKDGVLRISRYWSPAANEPESRLPFDQAAEELRELLCGAVAARLDPQGPTSIWLSGGFDSTAVFAAGEEVLKERGEGSHLQAVSVSYPPGDPGREDELIQLVVDHWGTSTTWIDIDDIPLFDKPQQRAASRDEPFAHGFEMFNRRLAETSRDLGARVAFTGVGGDPLFALSPVFLADLLRGGQWIELAREWKLRSKRGRHYRQFFRWAVQPLLTEAMLRAATILRRGRPLRGYLERPVAPWMNADFARRHGLAQRERDNMPARGRRRAAEYELYWYFTYPYMSRIYSLVCAHGLESGIELRSPLLDRRVIEFARRRPRWERSSRGENKRLLRRAMQGLLPAEFLAPRRARTGLSSAYFERSLRNVYGNMLLDTFKEPLLGKLGIVDPVLLHERCENHVRRGGAGVTEVQLFFAFQTELWLREHCHQQPQNRSAEAATRKLVHSSV